MNKTAKQTQYKMCFCGKGAEAYFILGLLVCGKQKYEVNLINLSSRDDYGNIKLKSCKMEEALNVRCKN